MQVEILEPKGYCVGVSHAINVALSAKKEHPECEVFVLGMLVHNDFVIQKLEEKGIHTAFSLGEIPSHSVIVFTAHGHDERLEEIKDKYEKRRIKYGN